VLLLPGLHLLLLGLSRRSSSRALRERGLGQNERERKKTVNEKERNEKSEIQKKLTANVEPIVGRRLCGGFPVVPQLRFR
jgi:hypothetical protein